MADQSKLNTFGFAKELQLLLQWLNEEEIGQLPDGLDWNLLVRLAAHHRVYPVLSTRIKNQAGVPADVVRRLERLYERNTYHMLHLAAEMKRIYETYVTQGIRCLQLKGPTLAAELYGDVSLRASGDLDMLVDIKDLSRAEKQLIKLGYEKEDYIESVLSDWKWRHHHVTYIHPLQGTKVELHWRLSPGPGKEPSFEQLWVRRRSSALLNVPVLSWEDLFIFLVFHGSRHGWSRMRWLYDIRLIVERSLDWKQIMTRMRKCQQEHVGGQALLLASNIFQQSIDQEMKPLIRGKRPIHLAQDALFYMEQIVNLHIEPVPEHIAVYHKRYLFALKSVRQRFWFVLSMLHPYAKDTKTLPLPEKLHFLYFVLRPFLMAWRKAYKQANE